MKYKSYIITALSLFLISYSCKMDEDFVERNPLGNYTDAAVYSNLALSESAVNSMYRNIWAFPFSFVTMADYVDEAQSIYYTSDILTFCNSGITENGITGWYYTWQMANTRRYNWDELYQVVRQTNLLLSNVDNIPAMNPNESNLKRRLKGEAFFVRALAYHYLTSLYGGVPIVEKVFEPTDKIDMQRDTYENCIDFIITQLDSAANILPLNWDGSLPSNNEDNIGRATKGAALALKSRVLLYAASDLHQTMSSYAPGYAYPELLGYTGGDRNALWTSARNAAKAVMDLGIYELYKASPADGDSVAENIAEYFVTKDMTSEDILYQRFGPNSNESWDAGQPQQVWAGGGWNGWGTTTPIGDLIDDYEMNDGSRFDWNNPMHAAAPYSNRDARLYASVLYEGANWIMRPTAYVSKDPFNVYQTGQIKNMAGDALLYAGLDNRNGNASNAVNCSYTGYNMRKFLDPTVIDINNTSANQWIPFRYFRFAEILLNYAEACIALGEENEARTYINKVRTRAGQPALDATVTGAELLARYRNERRIELAFENHRFFDVRRWMIGPDAYHAMHGVEVTYSVPDGTEISGYFKNPATGEKWSTPVYKPIVLETRSWNDKSYFFPLMRTELGRNLSLVQNPGYGGL